MDPRPFIDKAKLPGELALQAALGCAYTCYQKVISLVSAFSQEWTFNKSSGWMLKVYDRKKALFYLIPLDGSFKLSLAIRESEREILLGDKELSSLRQQISLAKKYIEGFALQFDIANSGEFQPIELFIQKLIALRSLPHP